MEKFGEKQKELWEELCWKKQDVSMENVKKKEQRKEQTSQVLLSQEARDGIRT